MAGEAAARHVEIHYTRPPDRTTIFRQHLVHRTTDCIITLLNRAEVGRTVTVRGEPVLERGAPIVWFTFPGAWHDIGRFHSVAGDFTGYYANVLTPVRFITPWKWETTDLFVDVWVDDRGAELLDEAELDAALLQGVIPAGDAARARAEGVALLAAARAGTWPPRICREWTLDRARSATARTGGTPGGAAV